MADKAHIETDERLEEMERHLSAIFSRAQKETGKAWKKYLKESGEKIAELQKDYDKAKDSGDAELIRKAGYELGRAKRGQTLQNKRFKDLTEQTAQQILHINETALAYINGELPAIYALNYNALEPQVENIGGYSFTLTDPETVKNLATKDETLLPYKIMDGKKDVRWNTKKINAEVLQGILQGESMDKIAGRLSKVLDMDKTAAIRNARTTVTSAECKGRQDSYIRAKDDGIQLQREWVSAIDKRTRHAHVMLNGQIAEIEKPFRSELGKIMYPGDPEADPANVYNCRCTLVAKVIGFEKKKAARAEEESRKVAGKPKAKAGQGTKSVFTPATTIEEAEAYAGRFVETYKTKYSGKVEYKGIDVSFANDMNRAFSDVFSKYSIPNPLRNITPFNTRKAQFKDTTAEAAYQWGLSDVYYNKKYYKTKKAFSAHLKESEELTEQVIGGVDLILDKYKDSTSMAGKLKYNYLKAFKETGRSNVYKPDAYGSMIHELGHCLDDKIFRSEIKRRGIDLGDSFRKYSGNISAYATSNIQEYMAESFAAFWKGETSKIDPNILAIFKEMQI